MKRRGFTLVELLVVISIIALLMAVLMPALAEIQRMAQRVMCGAKLKGLGNSFGVYASQNDGDYPRAGGRKSEWTSDGQIADWDVSPLTAGWLEESAFGFTPPEKGQATITSDLFLLVKWTGTPTKQFICKGDIGAEEFELSMYASSLNADIRDMTQCWDFGDEQNEDNFWPGELCSYAYHMPHEHSNVFSGGSSDVSYALTSSSNPSCAVAADRNPNCDKNWFEPSDSKEPEWKDDEVIDEDHWLNSMCHGRDGQNVLFIDGHVDFAKSPCVGVDNDNIYRNWRKSSYANIDAEEKQLNDTCDLQETNLGNAKQGPKHKDDSFLVNEWNGPG